MKSKLLQVAYEQQERLKSQKPVIQRDIMPEAEKFLTSDPRVLVVTGMRRVGKSTLVQQMMSKIGNYCFLNFEDEKLLGFTVEQFDDLKEALLEVYGTTDYYFFDEIQNVDRFEIAVRKLQDEGKKVILTGSNSSMINMEFGTKLTGRYKQIELFPFSFHELLVFKGFQPEDKDFLLPEGKVKIRSYLNQWLEEGGLPEYLQLNDKDYVRTLFDNILYRDIIVRYGIRRHKEFRELVQLLAANLTLPVSFSSLQKAVGLSNADTVREYLGFLSDAYMFFELRQFHQSFKRQLRNPRKIYIIDPAFHNLISFSNSQNLGRKLENAVYLNLKRTLADVYTYKGKRECDFITFDQDRRIQAFQVCYNLNSENEKREIPGLVEALEFFNLKEGMILTYDQETTIKEQDMTIQVVPVWKWLLKR